MSKKSSSVLCNCPATYSATQTEEEYNALHRFKLFQTECASPDIGGFGASQLFIRLTVTVCFQSFRTAALVL